MIVSIFCKFLGAIAYSCLFWSADGTLKIILLNNVIYDITKKKSNATCTRPKKDIYKLKFGFKWSERWRGERWRLPLQQWMWEHQRVSRWREHVCRWIVFPSRLDSLPGIWAVDNTFRYSSLHALTILSSIERIVSRASDHACGPRRR